MIQVCGLVTNFGTTACPTCARGGYSFIKLDKAFMIITYEWVFDADWLDSCIVATDYVEQLGAVPVFVVGSAEITLEGECYYEDDGTMTCRSGDYFMGWDGCDFVE